MVEQKFYDEARKSPVVSKEMIAMLMESMEYNGISFINRAIDILRIYKLRIERGDKITDEVSRKEYTLSSFKKFVKTNFSAYITGEVFEEKREKVYFSLESCEGGYNLIMTEGANNKTYQWISSLSESFSLVFMIATHIVYIKNIKNGSYQPFISENGKYCKYHKESGKILEV